MRVGVSLFFQNFTDFDRFLAGAYDQPPSVPDAQVYEENLRLGDLVEPLGFDSLWTVEHHGSPYAMTDNPLQLLAYFAGRTSHVDLGTMVIVAPWHDPIRVAEEITVLDHLLGDRRLYLGFGRGASRREFEGMRVDIEESRGRWAETMEIVRLAVTQERFSFDGEFHRVPETSVRPRPRSADLTERMYCAWNSPESMELAAREGFGQLFISLQSWEHAAQASASYNAIRAQAGWDPVRPISVIFVYCAPTSDDARVAADVYLPAMMDASIDHYEMLAGLTASTDPGMPTEKEAREALRATFTGLNVFGTPDECFARITEIQRTVDNAELICVFGYGGMPIEHAESSMRLFADRVLPRLHDMPGGDARAVPYREVARSRRVPTTAGGC
jgi:alkanesulfonate monooxygenase SsuD/methylene tetrahydromethanopterin reductase-like flavin-dependent oxidoreductase (luciferase family)